MKEQDQMAIRISYFWMFGQHIMQTNLRLMNLCHFRLYRQDDLPSMGRRLSSNLIVGTSLKKDTMTRAK